MKALSPEQIERLRKPFDKINAFEGLTDEQVAQYLNEHMAYWVALGNINLRLHQEAKQKEK